MFSGHFLILKHLDFLNNSLPCYVEIQVLLAPITRIDRVRITKTTLHAIHTFLQPELNNDLDQIMLWTAFTLVFFGFLRSSEFTCNGPFNPAWSPPNNITFLPDSSSPNHMLIRIKLYLRHIVKAILSP